MKTKNNENITEINLAAPNQQRRGFILRPSSHNENNNCDGSGPHTPGEVRTLPTGGGGNAILCLSCYKREIAYRKARNKELNKESRFDLPAWETLKPYPEPETKHRTLPNAAFIEEMDSDEYDTEAARIDDANGNFSPDNVEDYRHENIVRESIRNGQFSQAKDQCRAYGLNYKMEREAARQ